MNEVGAVYLQKAEAQWHLIRYLYTKNKIIPQSFLIDNW